VTVPARILAVDDNSANLDLMLYLLRAFGHEAHGESNGTAGIEAARTGGFALVLSDILMPGMDGYEFARLMKSDPHLQSTPLIAVTALAMPDDRERIDAAGFDGYISKPIEPATFVAQIEQFLSLGGDT
jgi:two-component system cell cycle response regulator